MWPWNLTDDPEKQKGTSSILCYFKLFASFRSHCWIETGVTVWKHLIWVKIDDFLAVWPCSLTNDLEKQKAPLLRYFKLCASFRSHWWIQTGVTVWKRPIWVKFDDFFSRVTLQFDRWPSKTVGHLFYATSSFVHYVVAIGDFKLELQSGNAQFGSNSTIFLPLWPWPLTSDLDLLHGLHFCHW